MSKAKTQQHGENRIQLISATELPNKIHLFLTKPAMVEETQSQIVKESGIAQIKIDALDFCNCSKHYE